MDSSEGTEVGVQVSDDAGEDKDAGETQHVEEAVAE
jgi:hypothetical protein